MKISRYLRIVTPSLAAMAAGVSCTVPDVELDPTPVPTLVSSGDYRVTRLELNQPDQGLDLDDDATADNNFPLLLDQFYEDLYQAVYPILEEQLQGQDISAQDAWEVLSALLIAGGFPISADAYDQTVLDAIRTTEINYLPAFSASSDTVNAYIYNGTADIDGYDLFDELGRFSGSGAPENTGDPQVYLSEGELELQYPGDWLALSMLEAIATVDWTGEGLSNGQMGGAVPLEDVVSSVLTLVPESIEVGGRTIELPLTAIEDALTTILEDAETGTGEPLFDLTLESRDSAISTAFLFEGMAIQRSN